MLGFLFGTACLFGFFYVLRRPRFGRGCANRPRGGRRMVSFLSRRVDATPAQEKAMRDAFNEVRTQADGVWAEVSAARSEVARAFRQPELDPEVIVGELNRPDDALAELRRSVAGRIAELHTILDPDQRETLADMLERDFRRPRRGPYRTAS